MKQDPVDLLSKKWSVTVEEPTEYGNVELEKVKCGSCKTLIPPEDAEVAVWLVKKPQRWRLLWKKWVRGHLADYLVGYCSECAAELSEMIESQPEADERSVEVSDGETTVLMQECGCCGFEDRVENLKRLVLGPKYVRRGKSAWGPGPQVTPYVYGGNELLLCSECMDDYYLSSGARQDLRDNGYEKPEKYKPWKKV